MQSETNSADLPIIRTPMGSTPFALFVCKLVHDGITLNGEVGRYGVLSGRGTGKILLDTLICL